MNLQLRQRIDVGVAYFAAALREVMSLYSGKKERSLRVYSLLFADFC